LGRQRAAVLLSRVRVATEVVVVVPALEVLVYEDHLVDLVADVGPKDLRGDARVVGNADCLADVVAQRGDDHLVVGSCPFRERRSLQAVGELVGREAVGDLGERLEHGEHPVGDPSLVLRGLGTDDSPLLGRRLVHSGEGGGHRLSLAAQPCSCTPRNRAARAVTPVSAPQTASPTFERAPAWKPALTPESATTRILTNSVTW